MTWAIIRYVVSILSHCLPLPPRTKTFLGTLRYSLLLVVFVFGSNFKVELSNIRFVMHASRLCDSRRQYVIFRRILG
jgi:hypothetical protein